MAEEEPRDLSWGSSWRPHTTTDAGAFKAARKFREMTNGDLNLMLCDLNTLPPELGQCQDLKILFCPRNQLVAVPPELGQCQALKGLYFHDNKLVSLPHELGQCQTLERVVTYNNPMTEFEGPDKEEPLDFLKEQWASRPITKSALKG